MPSRSEQMADDIRNGPPGTPQTERKLEQPPADPETPIRQSGTHAQEIRHQTEAARGDAREDEPTGDRKTSRRE